MCLQSSGRSRKARLENGDGVIRWPEILSSVFETGSTWAYSAGTSQTELGKLKPDRVMDRARPPNSARNPDLGRRRNSPGTGGWEVHWSRTPLTPLPGRPCAHCGCGFAPGCSRRVNLTEAPRRGEGCWPWGQFFTQPPGDQPP